MHANRIAVVAVSFALFTFGSAGLRSAPPQGPQAPLEPDMAAMDFVATEANGRPVKDLKASEVILTVDGRARPLLGLQYIELGGGAPLDRRGVIPKPLAAPFGSNMPADAGRFVMLVINHESITPGKERPARDAAIRFLASLSPRDRVGLMTMPRAGVMVDVTRDHEQIRTALGRVTGQAPQTLGQGVPAVPRAPGVSAEDLATSERACSSRLVLNELAGTLPTLGDPDEPKTIVFISSGLMPPTRDAPMAAPPGRCELKPQHYEEVATAARGARAYFYILQPNDLVADPAGVALTDMTASRFAGADDILAGLQNLAGVTGGEMFRLTGPADPVFARVAAESSGYYLADFAPDPAERNGLPHRVEVRVARPDVKLRYQSQLVLHKPEARKDPKFLSPHDMLRGTRRFRTLPMRAMAFASRMPEGSDLKVVAVAEPMDPGVPITSAAMALVDARNRLVKQWTAEKNDLTSSTLVAAFPTPPGNYRLRVAAIDARGRHGTVEYPFGAELGAAGPFKLSTMVLGATTNGNFQPRMIFGAEQTAVAYLELYGRGREPIVRIELAESDEGPAIVGANARATETQDPERRIVIGALPLASVFPGDYIVRAVVTDDGRPLGRTTRTLRKVVVRDASQ